MSEILQNRVLTKNDIQAIKRLANVADTIRNTLDTWPCVNEDRACRPGEEPVKTLLEKSHEALQEAMREVSYAIYLIT